MVSRQRAVVAALLILTAAMWGFSGFFEAEASGSAAPEHVGDERLIRPSDGGGALWPYTSSDRTVTQRTLAINIVVHGSDENVRRTLTKGGDLEFEPVEHEAENGTAAENGTENWSDDGPENETGGDDGTASGNETGNETDPVNETDPDADSDDGFADSGTSTPAETGTPNETLTPNESQANESAEGANNESQVVEIRPTGLEWTDAHGADRYTYVDTTPGDGGGQWIEESYQLRSGPYLGSRLHIRAYAAPNDDWTALQVHEDYWDWFRLRHTVSDTHGAARTVESNFIGRPYVGDVSRTYYGIDGGRSDGWLSEIELSPVPLVLSRFTGVAAAGTLALFGVVSTETQTAAESALRWLRQDAYRQRGGILLAGVLGGLVLGVRVGGIAIETTFPGIHPKLIVAVLYPVLAFGLPTVAAADWFTRNTDPRAAFGLVFVGVGAAFVLDFGVIGISAVPIGLVLHRCGLLVALGLVAAGTAHGGAPGRPLRLFGLAAWVVGLVFPLLGLL